MDPPRKLSGHHQSMRKRNPYGNKQISAKINSFATVQHGEKYIKKKNYKLKKQLSSV